MRAVNLLPPNAYAPKQRLPHAPMVLAATAPVLAGALLYLGYSLEHSTVVNRQGALGAVQSQIAVLGPTPELASESSGVAAGRSARAAELADVLSKQVPWDVAFDQISRVLPGNAWLTSLTAQSPTPSSGTASASPTAFSIQGYTYSQAAVARVLARLSLVPSLSGVTLVSSTAAGVGTKTVVQFSITASIKGSA